MQDAHTRAQIALEFLVVYSFVLLIFVLVFALIASQRATSIMQQQYAMLQLQAQNIASRINEGIVAGNGFSVALPLQSAFSSVPYNLSVSTTGVVIAKEKLGKQVISAYAFSSARNLVINGTLLVSGNGVSLYLLQTSSGTVRISNSKGTIYVNVQPPATQSVASFQTLNQFSHVKAAYFNGANGYVDVGNSPSLNLNGDFSIFAWVNYASFATGNYWEHAIIAKDVGGGSNNKWMFSVTSQTGGTHFEYYVAPSGPSQELNGNAWNVVLGSWNLLGITKQGSTFTFYRNGQPDGTVTNSNSLPSVVAADAKLGFAEAAYFNGELADVQVYGAALTAGQALQLYQQGMSSPPIVTANIVGWWPLNGNVNDFSGQGNPSSPNAITYNSVVYMNTHVALGSGMNAISALVGATASNGIFTTVSKPNVALYTNSTGYASAYLIAPDVPNLNFTLYGFNGNGTTVGNIIGWWPLEDGYGNTVYDLSTNYNNGVFANPGWVRTTGQLNSTAKFNGGSSNVLVSGMPALSGSFTYAAWVYDYPDSGFQELFNNNQFSIRIESSAENANQAFAAFVRLSDGSVEPRAQNNNQATLPNHWYFVASTWNGVALSLYVNGVLRASSSRQGTINSIVVGPTLGSGEALSGAVNWFDGQMADVQMYNMALTPQQIAQLYAQGFPMYDKLNVSFG